MNIGEVLDRLRPDFPGVTIPKIRFLEDKGLIKPERAPAGYRKFAPEDVERQVREPLRRLAAVTGRPAEAWAWTGGTPFDPAGPGDRAVRDAGVRLLCSDAQLERIT